MNIRLPLYAPQTRIISTQMNRRMGTHTSAATFFPDSQVDEGDVVRTGDAFPKTDGWSDAGSRALQPRDRVLTAGAPNG